MANFSTNNDAARNNGSTKAQILPGQIEYPFASGGFRWVGKGEYTNGERTGESCVIKWFKDETKQHMSTSDMFSDDIRSVEKAIEIITRWNNFEIIDQKIRMNRCARWHWSNDNCRFKEGDPILVEPFINNFEKFNSNSGWSTGGVLWAKVMQELLHFSYHITGGNLVLCDLQGGMCSDGFVFIL